MHQLATLYRLSQILIKLPLSDGGHCPAGDSQTSSTSSIVENAYGVIDMTYMSASKDIDPVDGNGLSECSHSENTRNSSDWGSTKYHGVDFDEGGNNWWKPWRASFAGIGKRVDLGRYATAELAALAYDNAAREKHGDFARLNFPSGGPVLPVRHCATEIEGNFSPVSTQTISRVKG